MDQHSKDVNNKADIEAWRQLSLSDLTMKEILQLVKDYLTALFGCLLIFALPYALIVGLDFGLKASLTRHGYSWWSMMLDYGLLALVAYLVLTNIPEVFESVGELFATLSQWARRVSRPMQVLGFIFLVCYWTAWVKYPAAAFWFSIVVLMPAGWTYDQYVKILKRKAPNQTVNS